jgi:predicted CoA-binding protein
VLDTVDVEDTRGVEEAVDVVDVFVEADKVVEVRDEVVLVVEVA